MMYSYGWPTPTDEGRLQVKPGDRFLRDSKGRAWLLRGVNLSGASKFPKKPVSIGSHVGGQLYLDDEEVEEEYDNDNNKDNDRDEADINKEQGTATTRKTRQEISFVGRPFELEDADEHLSRLRRWGFRLLRWVVTWEAIEHKGPGQYDEEFLNYTVKALDKAREYGFKVIIDFHQDVWSRYTGGSGAPLWTLYAAGLDPAHFHTTGTALVHNLWPCSSSSSSSSSSTSTDKPFPRMGWLTNYYKLACATMFTLFYAGSVLAPQCTFEGGINIQEYLQSHFLQAMSVLAQRIHAYDGGKLVDTVVLGWDSWNEPSPGWIGLTRLDRLPDEHDARQADMPTPFQSLQLGQGLAIDGCPTYEIQSLGPTETGTRTIDPQGCRAWLTAEKRAAMDRRYGIRRDATFPRPFECLWAQHGVWSIEDRKILQQDYFARGPLDHGNSSSGDGGGRSLALNWVEDHWTAFAVRVTQTVRAVHSSAVLFLEPPVYTPPPALAHRGSDSDTDQSNHRQWLLDNMVYAPHHYDDLALVVRRYFDWFNVDLLGLSRKRHSSILAAAVFGRQNSRRLFGQQIANMIKESDTNLGIRPVLIGETGVPMDLEMGSPKTTKPLWQRYLFPFASKDHTANNNSNNSDGGSTKFIQQGTSKLFQQCFENILQGLDRNLVHYTLWNYTPANTAEHGDHWNGENLSLYSKEQQLVEDEEEEKAASAIEVQEQSRSPHGGGGGRRRRLHPLDRGARALDVFCRPYPVVTVGTPVSLEFDRHRKVFRVWISIATDVTAHMERRTEAYHEGRNIFKEEHQSRQAKETQLATELYIPEHHFGGSTTTVIRVTDGDWYWDREQQLLYWYYDQLPQSDQIVSLLIASH